MAALKAASKQTQNPAHAPAINPAQLGDWLDRLPPHQRHEYVCTITAANDAAAINRLGGLNR